MPARRSTEPIGLPVVTLSRQVLWPGGEIATGDLQDTSPHNKHAVREAMDANGEVLVAVKLAGNVSAPFVHDLYPVAVTARVERGEGGPLLRGLARARLLDAVRTHPALRVTHTPLPDLDLVAGAALWGELRDIITYLEVAHKQVPPVLLRALRQRVSQRATADVVRDTLDGILRLPHLPLRFDDRMRLLCEASLKSRIEIASQLLRRSFDEMMAPPREPPRVHFSRARAVPTRDEAPPAPTPARPRATTPADRPVEELPVPVRIAIEKTKQAGAHDAAAHVAFLRAVPWAWHVPSDVDMPGLARRLDEHIGIGAARQPILENLALCKSASSARLPLCLVGPPGVGKGLLAAAIAASLGRPFLRVSLDAIDETALRGRARTGQHARGDARPAHAALAGASAGRLVHALVTAKCANPVILLDDIDEVADDDAASALAAAIDPDRNRAFRDHYAGVDIDLSRVHFIATATGAFGIPSVLRPRFEVVRMRELQPDEKVRVLGERLLPNALRMAGLGADTVRLTEAAQRTIVERWSRDPGVRDLALVVEKLARGAAVEISLGAAAVVIDEPELAARLGIDGMGVHAGDGTSADDTIDEAALAPTLKHGRSAAYEVLGDVVVGERIGVGGMAEVFVGMRQRDGARVAIKRMRADVVDEPGFRDMFLDEARLAARLDHANVVKIFEFGEHEGVPYLVMELCRGVSLSKIRTHARTLEPELVQWIGVHALDGLHYAHELEDAHGNALGVVHRDVSPQNLMVDEQGHVRVLDFGIARAAGRSTRTMTGVVKGKVAYMAPEQLDGTEDRRADLFAMGVVLCELLCGERHAQGDDIVIMKQLLRRDFAPPAALADAPDALREVVLRALHPEPHARWPSGLAMRDALAAALPMRAAARDRLGELVRVIGEPAAVTGARTVPTDVAGDDAIADAIANATHRARKSP